MSKYIACGEKTRTAYLIVIFRNRPSDFSIAATRSPRSPHALWCSGIRIMPSHVFWVDVSVSTMRPRCCSTGRIEECNKLSGFSSVFCLLERLLGVGWTALRGEGSEGNGTKTNSGCDIISWISGQGNISLRLKKGLLSARKVSIG
jgi:hypothetical protein